MRNAVLLLLVALARAGDDAPLRLERSIPLEDVQGRLDHLVLFPDGVRLAIAALQNDSVEILDLKQGRVVHRIKDVSAPTAGAFVRGALAMAAAGDGRIHFYDAGSYGRIRSVDVGGDADPVRIDGARLYVGVGEGALVAVDDGTKAFAIPLAAHPEGFQLETKGPRIFVNVPDAQHVAVLDREKRALLATWKLDVRDNYPMALDEERGRVLIGCRTPGTLLALDMKDGSVKARLDISGDVDDLWLDPRTRRLYASCGEGFLDVIDLDGWERVARVPTRAGARTCLFDPDRRRLFVAAPMHGGKAAEIRVYAAAPEAPSD
jgi:hypothetical protein